ncbi:hypothetical protein ACFC1B_07120 [Streptomyces xiamenensis]|uniref:hypothetical protein n=1 Tax=Streptomyces xiamenensis TaxID=408015 RepID=UPI0035DA3392
MFGRRPHTVTRPAPVAGLPTGQRFPAALARDMAERAGLEIVTAFANLKDAPVLLHKARFTTSLNGHGAPYAAHQAHEIDGFNWTCGGCQTVGRDHHHYNGPGYRPGERDQARDEANTHALGCAALYLPDLLT